MAVSNGDLRDYIALIQSLNLTTDSSIIPNDYLLNLFAQKSKLEGNLIQLFSLGLHTNHMNTVIVSSGNTLLG